MKKSKILMLLALTSATYMQQASVSRMGRSAASAARPIAMRGLGSSGQYLAPAAVGATGAFSPGGVQSRGYLTEGKINFQYDKKIDELRAKIDAGYDILADSRENITEYEDELETLMDARSEAWSLKEEYDNASKGLEKARNKIGEHLLGSSFNAFQPEKKDFLLKRTQRKHDGEQINLLARSLAQQVEEKKGFETTKEAQEFINQTKLPGEDGRAIPEAVEAYKEARKNIDDFLKNERADSVRKKYPRLFE